MNGAGLPFQDPIELFAVDPDRNIRRRYRIELMTDLLGMFIVDLYWGRIGAQGQAKRLSFGDRDAAEHYVTAVLRRRATAKKRIGVSYEPAAAAIAEQPR